MKILHTADWHIGQFKGPVVDGVNLRSQDTVKCLEYMVQVAIEEKPDIVCVSGDIFHQEQVGPVRYSDEMITATNIITSAYEIIGNLNKELEDQGYLTLRGKVPTKYFVKRFYGVEDTCEIPQEEGKEWFHA